MRLLRQRDEWYFGMDAQSAIASGAELSRMWQFCTLDIPRLCFPPRSPELLIEFSNQHEYQIAKNCRPASG